MTEPAPELPADYYRRNFVTVIDFVAGHYHDLLQDQERLLIERFGQCSLDAQCLYVRMLMRKGNLFRRDQLDYAEISDIDQAARELARFDLVAINPLRASNEYIALLRKNDLARLTAKPLSWSRERLVAEAELLDENQLADFCTALSDLYLVTGSDAVAIITLCFFANTRQTLAEFVIRDLGIMHYENYVIDRETRFFRSRAEIDDYQSYARLRDHVEASSEPDPLQVLESLPQATTHPNLKRRVDRFATQLLREVERKTDAAAALRHYQRWPVRDAFERMARLHEKTGDHAAAYAICENIIAAQPSNTEIEFVRKFSRKLATRTGKPALLAELDYTPPLSQVTLAQGAIPVEIACLHFLSEKNSRNIAEEMQYFYVENTLFNALFGLTFWPAIFASIPAAFVNPFQHAPKDLHDRDFHARRKSQISRLRNIVTSDAFSHHVMSTYRAKCGISNYFVDWTIVDEPLLSLALDKIPAQHLLAIFDRMLQDIANHCSGFPDLIRFDSTGYHLIEVKGPGDTVQHNQLAWMRYFSQHGIPHEVTHVRWQNR